MTPIEYITISREIMALPIPDKGKFILGMAEKFGSKGLMMSNADLADLLNCSEDRITKLLNDIKSYIRIENPQSRYRKIFYSGNNDGVKESLSQKQRSKDDSTPSFSPATPSFSPATPAVTTDIMEQTEKNTTTAAVNFSDRLKNLFGLEGLQTIVDRCGSDALRVAAYTAEKKPDNPTGYALEAFKGGWIPADYQTPEERKAIADAKAERRHQERMAELEAQKNIELAPSTDWEALSAANPHNAFYRSMAMKHQRETMVVAERVAEK